MPVYNFTTIDDPSASGAQTFANGINDTDQIVGWYIDKDGRTHGYIFDSDSGTYTTSVTLKDSGWLVGKGVTGTTFDSLFSINPATAQANGGTLAARPRTTLKAAVGLMGASRRRRATPGGRRCCSRNARACR